MNRNIISFLPLLIIVGVVGGVGYFLLISPEAGTASPVAVVEVTEETPATPVIEATAFPSPTATPTTVPPDTPTPQVSNPVTLSPTATVRPTDIPTPTMTPTFTNTSTPTSTSTKTPSPTPTATLTPKNPPPAPLADAVITLDNGFVSLRRGPGPNYEVVGTFRKGDKLEVQQRLFDNDEWLKVSVNSDSGEGVTGWITTDPDLVEINVALGEVPQMYEFGPKLLIPERFESRGVDGLIEFQWTAAPYPLVEQQYYSLLLVRDDLPDDQACFHWQTKEPMLSLTPEEAGCTPGAYGWRVGIATDLNGGVGEPEWRDDTEFDEKNPLGIGIPHPGRPKGGGDGNGSSGGSSGGSVGGG